MALKLVSINIERSKHLEKVLPFITREQPDVLCVQELMEPDLSAIMQAGSFVDQHYATMTRLGNERAGVLFGIGMFSTTPMESKTSVQYTGGAELPTLYVGDASSANNENRRLLSAVVSGIRIATTHFTWTQDGSTSDEQRRDLGLLLEALNQFNNIVLCGDFNAPRTYQGAPGEIFAALAARYIDNIPSEYTTSIDKDLHRAGDLQLMVDGLFTTPAYSAKDVHLVNGVSDHLAIVATIEKGTAVS